MPLGAVNPDNVNVLVAFGGGIVSILSPCVLPLVPGYLSMVTGLSVGELGEGARRNLGRIVGFTALFALGFTTVFTIFGLATTQLSNALFRNQETLTRISGVIVVLMAIYLAGSQLVRAPRLYGEARFQVRTERFGLLAAPVTGAAFAFGWTPCLGPVIAAVFAVAAAQSGVRSIALLVSYSVGMGVAFLAVGLAFGWSAGALDVVKRHLRAITLVSAAIMALFGILLILDGLQWMTRRLIDLLDAWGLSDVVELGIVVDLVRSATW